MLDSNADKLLGWLVRRLLAGAHTRTTDQITTDIERALRSHEVLHLWARADTQTKEDLKKELQAALGDRIDFASLEGLSRQASFNR